MASHILPQDKARRFWAKTRRVESTGCLVWGGAVSPRGYGIFCPYGTTAWLAHRVAWLLAHGSIPDDACVCHRCDNRRCVEHTHLFCGNPRLNSADMVAKGRSARGSKNGNARLADDDVREIRDRHAGGQSTAALARAFGVSANTIGRIVNGNGWGHIT